MGASGSKPGSRDGQAAAESTGIAAGHGERLAALLRFDVFGTLVGLQRAGGSWQAFYLGPEGKRRPADFVIPDFIQEAELVQFLTDLFHESASVGGRELRRL